MKRTGNLIPKIIEMENLELAFFKARKGKDAKQEVIIYRSNLAKNLQTLQQQILSGEVEVGNYHFFTIYDPKERQICAASFTERVLHHALMNICHAVFERQQIFDSYATRKSRGTYAALYRAEHFQKKYQWFLKLDIRKYFDSIDHSILFELLQRKFKDKHLLQIFKKIIESYQTQKDKGLPIGNLTSQYFANYFLSFTDHYIKEHLKVPAYVRYIDDMVLWHNDKKELNRVGQEVESFLLEKLALSLKTKTLNSSQHGLSFLGYRIFDTKTTLTKRSKMRFVKKAKKYNHYLQTQQWTPEEYQKHILPLLAYIRHAQTKGLRQKVFKTLG